MAENLFSIAKQIRNKLPASWYSLYQLAVILRDEPEIFHQAIADGEITPETSRWQIEDHLRRQRKEPDL